MKVGGYGIEGGEMEGGMGGMEGIGEGGVRGGKGVGGRVGCGLVGFD